MDYPRMLYRVGGPVALQDGDYDTLIVADEEADAAARAEDWWETPAAARANADEPISPSPRAIRLLQQEIRELRKPPSERAIEPGPTDDAPPTRDELEQKARELGIKFDGRWGDRRLVAAIAEAMRGGAP